MIFISQRSTCLSLKQLEDSDGLCGFGQVGVHPAVASFLTQLQLTTLLVAVFKADSQLSHVTAREHVRDPLDHKRTGLLQVGWARSCKGSRKRQPRRGRISASESGANNLTHRLWGRCGAPEALWVVAVLSCVPRAEAEVRDSGNGSRCRQCSSQNSGRAPEAPETHHVCDRGLWLAGLRSHVRLPPGCRRCAWPAWGRWCARCTWWKSPLEVRHFSQTLISAKRDRENLFSAPESLSLTVRSNCCIYLL